MHRRMNKCNLRVLTMLVVILVAGTVVSAESTVRVAIGTSLSTMDPQKQGAMVDMGVLVNMFDMLTFMDEDMNISPWLATEWYAVDDTTWEFKLREGVHFHNGEPFNAEVVKFSIERLLAPETASPIVELKYVEEVKVIDPYTVRIITSEIDPLIPAKLSLFGGVIVPMDYITEFGDEHFARNPVGTGPFEFRSWERDGSLVMEANDDYWGGRPQVDRVVIDAIPNDTSRVSALLAGDVDLITNLGPEFFPNVEDNYSLQAVSAPGLRMMFLSLDTSWGPLTDKRVRQAINYAIDYEAIIEMVLEGHGNREGSLIPSPSFGYNPNVGAYEFDPIKAKELLAEAGYADGFEVTIHGPSGRYLKDRDTILAIAAMLQDVGIRATAEALEFGVFLESLYAGKLAPIYLMGNLAWTLDGTNNLAEYVKSGGDWSRVQNPAIDDLQFIAETVVDQQERLAAFYEIGEIMHEEAYFVPLWTVNDLYGMSTRVQWVPRGNQVLWFGDLTIQ